MKTAVIVIVLGLVLGIAKVCINTKLFHREAYDKTFCCPNCSARFNVPWYKLIYKTDAVYTYNAAQLRCPVCHQKDMCSVANEDR